jgi:Transposase DDE domain
VAAWHAPVTGRRGGQPVYSDLAIETGLALRLVLHQPLRQNEDALRLIANLLGFEIRIPDQHGVRSCRRWRKLHLAVDADTREIAAVKLTPDDVGDVSAVADLLDQIWLCWLDDGRWRL